MSVASALVSSYEFQFSLRVYDGVRASSIDYFCVSTNGVLRTECRLGREMSSFNADTSPGDRFLEHVIGIVRTAETDFSRMGGAAAELSVTETH